GTMSRAWRRGGGCCWTTWISWCTCFIRSCGTSTSSSGYGATPRSSRRAMLARRARKDRAYATAGGAAGADDGGGGSPRGAVLRAEQGPIPRLRLQNHPDRAFRGLLLPPGARRRARRRPHGRARLRSPVADPAPPVPGPQTDHPLRLTIGLPADERRGRPG